MNLITKTLLLSALLTASTFSSFPQEVNYSNERFVIVLDVQQFWTDNSLKPEAAEEMLRSINAVIEKTNPAKIIYIKSSGESAVLSISLKGVKKTTFSANEFDKNLKIVNTYIFEKTEGDAFTVKDMTDIFESNNAKEIIITGLLAEECVYKTALGGLSRNYDIYLVPEAIGGKSDKSKQKALKKLAKAGAMTIILDNF